MKLPWFFKRYFWLVLVLLILLPLALSPFISTVDYHYQLRTVYLLQRLYVMFSALLLLLFIIAFRKISAYPPKRRGWKEPLVFSVLAGLFFLSAFSTQLDLDHVLSQGVGVTDRVDFDYGRWLAPSILSDIDVNPSRGYSLLNGDFILVRTVRLEKEELPADPVVSWHSRWDDGDSDGAFTSCDVLLGVNNCSFNVTGQYHSLGAGEVGWLEERIETAGRECLATGDNFLSLRKSCAPLADESSQDPQDIISVTTQDVYAGLRTVVFDGGSWQVQPFDELLLFVKEESSFSGRLLFKLGFIFRVLAVFSLFIAFFGLGFTRFLFSKAKIELGFSFVYSLVAYWFSQFIREYWLLLSKIVSYCTYALMKVTFLSPVLDFSNPDLPLLGARGFMVGMADTCSGIDSLAYFILAYSLLIVINWKSIDLKKAAFLFIPGLLGALAMNVIRIYLLFIIGIFFSFDFALNAYHTNAGMVLFIIYFVFFWQIAFGRGAAKETLRPAASKRRVSSEVKKR